MIKIMLWALFTVGAPMFVVGFLVGYYTPYINAWLLSFFS